MIGGIKIPPPPYILRGIDPPRLIADSDADGSHNWRPHIVVLGRPGFQSQLEKLVKQLAGDLV